MARNLTIELSKSDVAAVNKWLESLEKVDQASVIQVALKEGALVIQNAGKTNLASRNKPVTGNLQKSFAIKVVKKKAYALSGFKRPQGAHAHLVDRGTAKRYTRKGAYRGSVSKASPNRGSYFWTDAVEANGGRALNALMNAIYDAIAEISMRNLK